MAVSHRNIERRREVTPDRHRSVSIPPDTIDEGVRRLGWLALAYAIGNITGPFTKLVLAAIGGRVHASDFGIPDLFSVTAVIIACGVFAAARRGVLSATHLLDVGLVFQVIGALGIAVREFWHGLPPTAGEAFFVPAECVWLVAYPLLVPNRPAKVLVASVLGASMGPLGLWISAAAHGTAVDRPFAAATYFLTSSYPAAILAYLVARVVHRFNVQLKYAREIGSYELIERIGAGGMGEVWRAQHRMLACPAAIKLIRSGALGESLRAREGVVRRFEREARDTAALGSIHTIDVYDFGVTKEGDFYYAMELLEGLSIERLVSTFGAVAPARAVYLLRQVCHSLGEAHAYGLVHRDVKPANIMVCRLGPDDDFVKVLDFGIVKHTAAGPTATMLSMGNTLVGTPSYMAPEIALGHHDVDGRADIYSLGCVAYYMLTGRTVFSGGTAVAAALAHVRNAPVAPSVLSKFSIPPALDALIMACLAKNPAARPASAAIVSERLAASVVADAWTLQAAHDWWERHHPLTPVWKGAARAAEADSEGTETAPA